jgi:hypothetical protein
VGADGYSRTFTGIFWKCARIGERLSPYISVCCVIMAVSYIARASISWELMRLGFSLRWQLNVTDILHGVWVDVLISWSLIGRL